MEQSNSADGDKIIPIMQQCLTGRKKFSQNGIRKVSREGPHKTRVTSVPNTQSFTKVPFDDDSPIESGFSHVSTTNTSPTKQNYILKYFFMWKIEQNLYNAIV